MPPRRRTGQGTARTQQATLSFGSESRVTKPSATSSTKKTKNVEPIADEVISQSSLDTSVPAQTVVAPPSEASRPHIAEVVVREQAKSEIEKPLSEEDRRALSITDADLKRYWRAEEQKRKAPRGQSAPFS
jgi:DNA polymerase delta subunit 4